MAKINFGGVEENVVTREEFPLEKALETLKDETIAVIGYGVQGPGQSLNLRDNGFRVIVGQREGSASWDKAVADGWVPGQTLFGIEEAAERATIIQYLLSDAGQIAVWPSIKKHLTPGKALYFSHGFGITYKERTGIVPPADVDVILIAPKAREPRCGACSSRAADSIRAMRCSRTPRAAPSNASWRWASAWVRATCSKPTSSARSTPTSRASAAR